MSSKNSIIEAIVAAALGSSPAWGLPKTAGEKKILGGGGRALTSIARRISIGVRAAFGKSIQEKYLFDKLADAVSKNPGLTAAKLSLIVFALVESELAVQCSAQCAKQNCDYDSYP
jgi:F0F1-type ATP synthase membrane subunit c/vacuolar-type H+-ATPase subunit K